MIRIPYPRLQLVGNHSMGGADAIKVCESDYVELFEP